MQRRVHRPSRPVLPDQPYRRHHLPRRPDLRHCQKSLQLSCWCALARRPLPVACASTYGPNMPRQSCASRRAAPPASPFPAGTVKCGAPWGYSCIDASTQCCASNTAVGVQCGAGLHCSGDGGTCVGSCPGAWPAAHLGACAGIRLFLAVGGCGDTSSAALKCVHPLRRPPPRPAAPLTACGKSCYNASTLCCANSTTSILGQSVGADCFGGTYCKATCNGVSYAGERPASLPRLVALEDQPRSMPTCHSRPPALPWPTRPGGALHACRQALPRQPNSVQGVLPRQRLPQLRSGRAVSAPVAWAAAACAAACKS